MVSYDVPAVHPERRRELSRILEGRGRRVLYSVFEVWAPEPAMTEILVRAESLVSGGALLAQPWCARCRQHRLGDPIERWDMTVVIR